MLLPALSGAKLRAQQTQCINNLRQLSVADRVYWDDHSDFADGPYWGPDWLNWPVQLQPYGATPALLLCPAATITNEPELHIDIASTQCIHGTADRSWASFTNSVLQSIGSYGYNNWLTYEGAAGIGQFDSMDHRFSKNGPLHPSETPQFADATLCWVEPLTNSFPSLNLYTPASADPPDSWMIFLTIARHGRRPASAAPRIIDISQTLPGMIDLAACDGHVEKALLENLWNYSWYADWQVPNPRPGR